jgi:periplasmic protein TonB
LTPNGNSLTDNDEIVCISPIEQLPEFPGGQSEMFKFILKNLKVQNIENSLCTSRIFIQFTVKSNGKVENPNIIKGAEFCPNLRNELINVINKMPKWKAGKFDGKLSDIKYTIPLQLYFEE